jgi:hypothetical protein
MNPSTYSLIRKLTKVFYGLGALLLITGMLLSAIAIPVQASFVGQCSGDCDQIWVTICNSGSGDMTAPVDWDLFYAPSGDPKNGGWIIASGTVGPLVAGACTDIRYDPVQTGSYKFRADQSEGHPGGPGGLPAKPVIWSDTCSVICKVPTEPTPTDVTPTTATPTDVTPTTVTPTDVTPTTVTPTDVTPTTVTPTDVTPTTVTPTDVTPTTVTPTDVTPTTVTPTDVTPTTVTPTDVTPTTVTPTDVTPTTVTPTDVTPTTVTPTDVTPTTVTPTDVTPTTVTPTDPTPTTVTPTDPTPTDVTPTTPVVPSTTPETETATVPQTTVVPPTLAPPPSGSGGPELIPVTGADLTVVAPLGIPALGLLQGVFFNLGLALFGIGLVLQGLSGYISKR